jgi:ribosomal protein S18 acetylase RimI-like enzyme
MPALPEDAGQLAELVNSAYRGESSRQGWTNEAELLDGERIDENELFALLHNPFITILKYQPRDMILGCVQLEQKEDILYIGMLTVSPALQTQGIGKRLLKAAEDHAKQQGYTMAMMTVITVRVELIRFYERQGYVNTGYKQAFPKQANVGMPKMHLELVTLTKAIS